MSKRRRDAGNDASRQAAIQRQRDDLDQVHTAFRMTSYQGRVHHSPIGLILGRQSEWI